MSTFNITTLAAFIALGITSQAAADQGAAMAAAKTGSARLLAYALSDVDDSRAKNAADLITYKMGYGENQAGIVTEYRYDIAPMVRYDNNINDGFSNDSFVVAGYEFLLDDKDVAQSGVLVGGSVTGHANVTVAQNLALQIEASGYKAFAVGKGVDKGYVGMEACLSYRLSADRYVDGCVSADASDGAKSSSHRTGYKASFTQMASLAGGVQEFKLSLGSKTQTSADVSFDQTYVSASVTSAFSGGSVWAANVRLGEKVDGSMASTSFASLSTTRAVMGRPTTVRVSYGVSEGGYFLGDARREDTVTLSAGRQINDKISIEVNWSKTSANQDFFETSGFGGGVSFNF